MPQVRAVDCAECGEGFEATSTRAKFCSPKCRKAANRRPARRGQAETPTAPAPEAPRGGLVGAVSVELSKLEALDTVDGRAALALAYRIESPMETGAAAASMTVQLHACMDRVRKAAAPKQRDNVDDLLGSARGKLRAV